MEKKLISLENFNPEDQERLIDSPFSIEALKRQGLKPKDVVKMTRSKAEDILCIDDQEIIDKYLIRHEERRQRYVNFAIVEKQKILNSELNDSYEKSQQERIIKTSRNNKDKEKDQYEDNYREGLKTGRDKNMQKKDTRKWDEEIRKKQLQMRLEAEEMQKQQKNRLEEQRLQIEKMKENMKEQARLKALKKKEDIEKVIRENKELQEEKKNAYLEAMSKAQMKKAQLEKEAKIQMEKKQYETRKKEMQRLQVIEKQKEIEEKRVKYIKKKQKKAEKNLQNLKEEQENSQKKLNIWRNIQRKEKIDEVKRIQKKKEYEREMTQKRIKEETERTHNLMTEKQKMLEHRLEVRRHLEKQKQTIIKVFSQSQKNYSIMPQTSRFENVKILQKKHKKRRKKARSLNSSLRYGVFTYNDGFGSIDYQSRREKLKFEAKGILMRLKNKSRDVGLFEDKGQGRNERNEILLRVAGDVRRKKLKEMFEIEKPQSYKKKVRGEDMLGGRNEEEGYMDENEC